MAGSQCSYVGLWIKSKMTQQEKEEEEGENVLSITYGFAEGKKNSSTNSLFLLLALGLCRRNRRLISFVRLSRTSLLNAIFVPRRRVLGPHFPPTSANGSKTPPFLYENSPPTFFLLPSSSSPMAPDYLAAGPPASSLKIKLLVRSEGRRQRGSGGGGNSG